MILRTFQGSLTMTKYVLLIFILVVNTLPAYSKEKKLEIRSNKYDDHVTVNGKSYGSSPVDIILKKGRKYKIKVDKNNFYSETIVLDSNHVPNNFMLSFRLSEETSHSPPKPPKIIVSKKGVNPPKLINSISENPDTVDFSDDSKYLVTTRQSGKGGEGGYERIYNLDTDKLLCRNLSGYTGGYAITNIDYQYVTADGYFYINNNSELFSSSGVYNLNKCQSSPLIIEYGDINMSPLVMGFDYGSPIPENFKVFKVENKPEVFALGYDVDVAHLYTILDKKIIKQKQISIFGKWEVFHNQNHIVNIINTPSKDKVEIEILNIFTDKSLSINRTGIDIHDVSVNSAQDLYSISYSESKNNDNNQKTTIIYSLTDGNEIRKFTKYSAALRISLDGKYLYGSNNESVYLLDIATGSIVYQIDYEYWLGSLELNSDSSLLAVTTGEGVDIWELQ